MVQYRVNSTWLVTSRLDMTRSTCRARRDEHVEPVELVMSSVWSCAVRQARHSQTCRVVSRRDVTSHVEFGLMLSVAFMLLLYYRRFTNV